MSCEAAKIVPARPVLPAVQSGTLPAPELLLPRAALLFSRCYSTGCERCQISQLRWGLGARGSVCGAPWHTYGIPLVIHRAPAVRHCAWVWLGLR